MDGLTGHAMKNRERSNRMLTSSQKCCERRYVFLHDVEHLLRSRTLFRTWSPSPTEGHTAPRHGTELFAYSQGAMKILLTAYSDAAEQK
jgi:hypothetical protein